MRSIPPARMTVVADHDRDAEAGRAATIETVVRDVSPKDLMLALRVGDGHFSADVPLSASSAPRSSATVRSTAGRPHPCRRGLSGRATIRKPHPRRRGAAGPALEHRDPPSADAVDAQSGPSRVSFVAQLDVPAETAPPWCFRSRAVSSCSPRRPLARSAADHRPRLGEGAHRSGQAAVRDRSGGPRRHGRRLRDLGRDRLFDADPRLRSASPARA